jgi:hypothetical protein
VAVTAGSRSTRRRRAPFLAAGLAVAALSLAACGGGGGGTTNSKSADQDATAACAALARSSPVGAGTIALDHRLQGAAELGLSAVAENGATYTNLSQVMQNILNDLTGAKVSALNGDVTNALSICKGDSLPH